MLTSAKFNKDQNTVEFISDVEIINQKTNKDCNNCCKIFTPLAPYDTVSCVVTAPRMVSAGQPFIIDYALNVRSLTYISFWADLLPSFDQMMTHGLILVDYKAPVIGFFDQNAESVAHKGGRGVWQFQQAVPAGTYHISFTFIAHQKGIDSFTTLLATNPPSYIKMADILAVDENPLAQNDHTKAYDNQPVVINVLDNDCAHSSLCVKEVSMPMHGTVVINPDNTITYTSASEFRGKDTFTYTVQDMAGNRAKATVEVDVEKCPVAKIIN